MASQTNIPEPGGSKPIPPKIQPVMVDGVMLGRPYFLPETVDKLKTFQCTPEDIVVATYPKSGTTWMAEIMNLLKTGGKLDTTTPFTKKINFIDMSMWGMHQLDVAQQAPPPRMIRSHFPYRFLKKQVDEDKVKVIVVMRNIKDVLVSFFNFYKMNQIYRFEGTWDDYFALFKEKQLHGGDWFDINLEWWDQREKPNVLIIKFEDMKKDVKKVIRQVAEFYDKSVDEAMVTQIAENVSFNKMKANYAKDIAESMPFFKEEISPFFRKGEVGDWKNYFTDEQNKYVDELIKTNLQGTGLDVFFAE